MGSEYFINSQALEDKVRQLLPSQGGAGAGFDLSASTQIVPIIDLTESGEGSNLRQDLQTSFSHDTLTNTNIVNATNTIIANTPGYYTILASYKIGNSPGLVELNLFDGTTSKTLIKFNINATGYATSVEKLIICLEAGDSLRGTCASTNVSDFLNVSSRQIANIDGELSDPT